MTVYGDYNAVWIPFTEEPGLEEIRDICDPLKENYDEFPALEPPETTNNSDLERGCSTLQRPLDRRTKKLFKQKDGELSEVEVTDYVDSEGLAAREYFLMNGRIFLSRDEIIEGLANDSGIEYELLE